MTLNPLVLERVVELSRIRRGRLATSPTWYVRNTLTEERVRFPSKRAARAFIAAGGCPRSPHPESVFWCRDCDGSPAPRRTSVTLLR